MEVLSGGDAILVECYIGEILYWWSDSLVAYYFGGDAILVECYLCEVLSW